MKLEVRLRFKLKIFDAVPKNNPQTYPPQQNKKAILTTASYFIVSTPVRSQTITKIFYNLVYQKECFRYKTEKVSTIMDFRISLGTKFQLKLAILIC